MTRHSSSNLDPISFVSFLAVAGVFGIAIALDAPLKVTFFGVLGMICALAAYFFYYYCIYIRRLVGYEWQDYRRTFRIWPIAATFVYLFSTAMIDQAGSVDYSGLFNPKKPLYHHIELAWYSLWYVKIIIAASIFVGGQCIHKGIVHLWDAYVN